MHIPDYFEFYNKSKISSGKKALENIPFDLRSMNAEKPLVLTDALSVKLGYVSELKKAFHDSGMIIGAVYDRVTGYPSTSTVKEVAVLYRDRGCDSIIALGGSSPAAIAKGLNIIVSNKSTGLISFDDMKNSAPLRPFIFVPSLYADSTETSYEAIIDSRIFRSYDLMPDIVVIDGRILKKGDAEKMLHSGLMAMAQSIEACTFSDSNPVNDSFAYASISSIYQTIEAVTRRCSKSADRLAFVNGVAISGIVYSNAPEGLARAIGFEAEKITGHPAGLIAGIVLPFLLDYKMRNIKEGVRPELLLPLAGIDRYCGVNEKERAAEGVELLFAMSQNLKKVLPRNLQELKIPEYTIRKIASAAEVRTGKGYPAGAAMKILEFAYRGKTSVEGK